MAQKAATQQQFNVVIVGQRGRLAYEALLFAASLRHASPSFTGRFLVAEPQPGPLWPKDPTIANQQIRAALKEMGAEFVPFENRFFGATYPNGNKIEMLRELPKGEPFVFFDTDTLITSDLSAVPFDFDRPSASLRREGTWPQPQLYGPGYEGIWRAVYEACGVEFDTSMDLAQPDEYWRRYLYFNAGFFYYRCPHAFGALYERFALTVRDNTPEELCAQSLDPWLDQIALPPVIHTLGGGRDALPAGLIDGSVTCHYRTLPLLYARESDAVVALLEEVAAPNRIKKLLKEYAPIKRNVYHRRGQKVRALFDQQNLPKREAKIRNRIKAAGFWMR